MTLRIFANTVLIMISHKRDSDRDIATPTQRLASMLLKQDVTEYVIERRHSGKSWRRIASDLRDDTNGAVDVTYETLRSWVNERTAREAS